MTRLAVCVLLLFTSVAARADKLNLVEKYPAGELIEVMRNMITGHEVIGIWIDERHPCGLVAIVAREGKLRHVSVCADRSVDNFENPLQPMKPPAAATGAWRTPGLTRNPIVVLGNKTVEYLDRNGTRHDLDTFTEKVDGKLYGFHDGVGSEDPSKPWMVGERVRQ